MALEIRYAYNELDEIRKLFDEYTAMLDLDLSFQNYKDELKSLPGKYDMPNGRLYTAAYDNDFAGCIGLRPLKDDVCEMKRLFVKPRFRGYKIGKSLVEKIIADAKDIGYNHMVLDTIPALSNAITLYKSIGFYEIEPYCFNPAKGALFFRLDL